MSRRGAVQRSPTFFVGAEKQKKDLDAFQRREQQLAEVYYKNKPLCFNACTYQRTHPVKANSGHRDADATLVSPMAVGVADGVSQIEEYGIDSSELPTELLRQCEELAFDQLLPRSRAIAPYHGPIPLVREAFCGTECLGSTTLVLALLDNSTRIHGKLHPMIAVISIGDCELVILRRLQGRSGPLELVFHTEIQRVDGHCQTPLQLARVDDRIDAAFDDSITVEVIERGSAVHCISAYEGDIVIVGSDGVFDNLYLDEVAAIANKVLPPSGASRPTQSSLLTNLSKRIVEAAHQKTKPTVGGFLPEAPIGRGGKMDDTSCVVAEIIEWTEAHQKLYAREEVYPKWSNFWHCQVGCDGDENELQEYDGEMTPPGFRKKGRRDDEMFCSIS